MFQLKILIKLKQLYLVYIISQRIFYNGKLFEEENEKFKLSEKMKINLKYFAYN